MTKYFALQQRVYFCQGMTSLPDYVVYKEFPGVPLNHCFSAASDDLLELIAGLLRYNPVTRLSATKVGICAQQINFVAILIKACVLLRGWFK